MTQTLPAMRAKLVSGLLLVCALTACLVGPDYAAPRAQLAAFHNLTDASISQGRSTPPLDRWWTGFNDPMLVTVVQRALDQNLDLAAAVARVRQSRAAAAGAGAELLPTADFGASDTFQRQSLRGEFGSVSAGSPGFSRDGHEDVVGPSASWKIDLFGGLSRDATAAQEEAQAAKPTRRGRG
jgi:outer membrane protein TolC